MFLDCEILLKLSVEELEIIFLIKVPSQVFITVCEEQNVASRYSHALMSQDKAGLSGIQEELGWLLSEDLTEIANFQKRPYSYNLNFHLLISFLNIPVLANSI